MARGRMRSRGFTLGELLVTLAVLAVVLTVAVPAFTNFVKNNRLAAATNQLGAALAYARSEAVRRGRPVTVCASSDGATCDTTAWREGWIVFTDEGVAGQVDAGDTVLRVSGPLGGDVEISFSSPAGLPYVRFLSLGELDA